jgi:hypothetical protein
MARANSPNENVRALQRRLYVAAKRNGKRKFPALLDRIARLDVLRAAWEQVQRNRGAAGIDGETLKAVEAYGVERMLEELRERLLAGRYRPQPSRRVLIPKPGRPGEERPLSIPRVRDRVAQTAAKLVLEPIFEAGCAPRGAVMPDEVRDLVGRLSQQSPGSWGQPEPGGAGIGWEQPRQRSRGAELPDAPAAQARRKGIAKANEWTMPLDSKTAPNLADMGRRSAGEVPVGDLSAPWPANPSGPGGRGEGLRRTHGDAAGVKLGSSSDNRLTVNVGSVLTSPHPPGHQSGDGQAHRRLTEPGRGRAFVVVRRRESRRHGEGRQQVCGWVWSREGRR